MPDKATAKHLRHRAESLRSVAVGIYDREDRKKLLEIAEEYERWAREREAAGG